MQADVSIYLPPSADFKLGNYIYCSSNIKVTVASSGEGATLDGQEQTGLFYLQGGCSLTLRGLTLVNGRAEYGGVVDANGAGDVEIIDSTIRDCRADNVRRLELPPPCSATRQRGERWKGTRLALPRSLLATAVRRRCLRVQQRCGLDKRLGRDRLLC